VIKNLIAFYQTVCQESRPDPNVFLPKINPQIIKNLGNAASTGAAMVLLSKAHWQKADELGHFIDHIELSTRLDFNQYFIESIDFPEENLW
jgi:uncharacterized 2Fe-2S/4Fe-4S cluster protein (DUF4445 family)